MLLDFAVGNQPQQAGLRIGQVIDAELVYFDGAPPLRALLKQRFEGLASRQVLPGAVDIEALQRRFAAMLAENPLLERWPHVVGPVRICIDGARTELIDGHGRSIAVSRRFKHAWTFEALSGGGTLNVFGLWDGWAFDPISVEHEGSLFSLGRIGELAVLSRAA
jgi:hypothetical protein